MSTYSVGQEVWMKSGMYAQRGKVVAVRERCVEVELLRAEGPVGLKYLIRFDTNGKACDSSDIYEGNMWGGPDPRIPGTHEFGPWHLEAISFSERTVLREQGPAGTFGKPLNEPRIPRS
jgi:hypothetical protein